MTDREIMQMALDAMLNFPDDISDDMFESIKALRAALAQPEQEELGEIIPADEEQLNRIAKLVEQEPVAWRSAAIRIGEELSSVGPDLYYEMTAEQWLDWALKQNPRGKNSLPPLYTREQMKDIAQKLADSALLSCAPPQREWQGLTDEERQECLYSDPIFGMALNTFASAIEAKLKEKNGL